MIIDEEKYEKLALTEKVRDTDSYTLIGSRVMHYPIRSIGKYVYECSDGLTFWREKNDQEFIDLWD